MCFSELKSQDVLVLKTGEVKIVYNVELGDKSVYYNIKEEDSKVYKIDRDKVFTVKHVSERENNYYKSIAEHDSLVKYSVTGTGSSSLVLAYMFNFDKAISWKISEKYNLPRCLPLYLDAGIGLQYIGWKNCKYKKYEDSSEANLISLNIPIALGYKCKINENVTVSPIVGMYMRVNVAGWTDKKDLFSDKENIRGMGIYAWDRVQFGMNFGVGLEMGRVCLGLSYCHDFTDIAENIHLSTGVLSVGYNFCLFKRVRK